MSKSDPRERYLQSQTGDLTRYAALLGEGFSSRINLLAQLIHDNHAPSVGAYKERLLAETIRQFIPERYSVGTGFVVFPTERSFEGDPPSDFDRLNRGAHIPSRQCDIVVYDAWNHPVVFRDQDFVVVRPESVRAVIEIKGTLNSNSTKEGLQSLIDFGNKWQACTQYYKANYQDAIEHSPGLFLLAWQVGVSTDGKLLSDGTRLRKAIHREYSTSVDTSNLRGLPILTSAYIYNDCIVSATTYADSGCDPECSFGFMTDRGQMVRFDDTGNSELAGDRTIASLLSAIQVILDTPFNRFFSYPDQSNSTALHEHPHSGYTQWLTDPEMKDVFQ